MGWGDCGKDKSGRPIGYSHKAKCDYPGCDNDIDRGLSFVCGGMHGEDEISCDRYFCLDHLFLAETPDGRTPWLCPECHHHNSKTILAIKFIEQTISSYEIEGLREPTVRGVFAHFRENPHMIEAVLDNLTVEEMTTELIVTFGMATNAHLGKTHPVRNSFCRYVLSYFDDAGMNKEQVRSIFSIKEDEE